MKPAKIAPPVHEYHMRADRKWVCATCGAIMNAPSAPEYCVYRQRKDESPSTEPSSADKT